MRLRHILFFLLVLAAQIPVAGLGVWTRNHIINSEISDVSDRHLLIARNLALSLARYHGDLVSGFDLASANQVAYPLNAQSQTLLDKLGLRTLCSFSLLGKPKLIKAEGSQSLKCADIAEKKVFSFVLANALGKKTTISPLYKLGTGDLRLFAVNKRDNVLRVGAIEPAFFRALAAQVRFGAMGHAVIVDQAGQVLAHPKKEWENIARPLGDAQIVRAMLRGDTGVMQFESPSLKGEMIAGFSGVEGAGWGVMIPQPVSELNIKAFDAVKPIYFIVSIGLAIAALAAVYVSHLVAHPLEKITLLARKVKSVAELSELPELKGVLVPAEPREIVTAYNGMVRAIKVSEEKVRYQAYTDGLTGLLNRRAFNEAAEMLFGMLKGKQGGGVLFYFDLDGFKNINDTHGHAIGDKVLLEASRRTSELCKTYLGLDHIFSPLITNISDMDRQLLPIFARVGGDEFVLVLPQAGSLKMREHFANELTACLLAPYIFDDLNLKAGASIGCAVFPEGKDTLDAALHRADAALYHAKARGKGQFCFYGPKDGVRSIVEIRREIAEAISKNEMVLHYQPKLEAKTGAANSVEALVRWQHPVLGLQSPITFIPHIEDSVEICALGEWVLRQASRDLALWQSEGRTLSIAVNVGAKHLVSLDFPRRALEIVQQAGIDPRLIELEITEEIAMQDNDNTRAIIDTLKSQGFSVALDDYGRGYSNLSRLADLKVDVIKIDRSLIMNVESHERTRKIVAATIAMADALDCRVVAEGIEEASHAALLRKLGCHELQGYFFAKPMERAALNIWFNEREKNTVAALRDQISTIM
jgi:predicted signal transduction protein with EAL and GGDEF domain